MAPRCIAVTMGNVSMKPGIVIKMKIVKMEAMKKIAVSFIR